MKNVVFSVLRKPLASLAAGALLIGLLPTTSCADTLVSGDYGNSGQFNDTVGFSFTLKENPMNVTSLGVYDANTNGLSRTNYVGLWDNSGVLLASVTINRSTNAPLVGFFRWADLVTPVTLSAFGTYRIGAQADIGEDRYSGNIPLGQFSGTAETTNVVFNGAVRGNSSGVFEFPDSTPSAGQAIIGPNASFEVIPEPTTYALLTMAGVGALWFAKRRR
jgi:hypothetical protein